MKNLFLSLTLLVAANGYAADAAAAKDVAQDVVAGASDTVQVVAEAAPTVLAKVTGAIKAVWNKVPSFGDAKNAASSAYDAGRANTYALIETAKNNPAYAAGAVVATVAGVWALNKTYRYFVPKKAHA